MPPIPEEKQLAMVYYDAIPCCCGAPACDQQISASPDPVSATVVIKLLRRNGRHARITLAPGWARVLAAHIDQAANQVRPRPEAKPTRFSSRISSEQHASAPRHSHAGPTKTRRPG